MGKISKKVIEAWAAVDNNGEVHLWSEGRYAVYSATHGKDVSFMWAKNRNNFKLVHCEIRVVIPDTKKCSKCKLTKPVSMFSKGEKSRSDGLNKTCQSCDTIKSREWRKKSPHKAYLKSRRHVEKYPYKQEARLAVKYAIKEGRLIREPCRDCGKTNVHAHHPDYSKPLEVVWLCPKHHSAVHHA